MGPRRLTELLEAVISLGSERDLAAVLRRIVEVGVELTGARYGALGVLDEQGSGLAEFITVGVDDETRRRIGALPKGRGLLGALISDARPLRVADLHEDPGRCGFPDHHPEMTSFLGVPIRNQDEVFGNLYLTDKRGGEEFTDVDEELMVGLAAAAGVAIDNARLFGQLQRREATLAAIHEVTAALLAAEDPTQSLGFVAEQALGLVHADVATFALPDAGGEAVAITVAAGALAADLAGARYPRSATISGDVLRSGETAVFVDLSQDHRWLQPEVRGRSVGPAIFTPLTSDRQPSGTLFVGRRRGSDPFSPDDLNVVRSFATQAGVVLEMAAHRRRLARLSVAEEQERIARDLHDTVIQQVFAVGLTLQGVLPRAGDEAVRSRIAAAIDDLDAVIRQVRTVIFDVAAVSSPTAPGLRTAILGLAREASRLLGFEPTVRFDGPVDTLVGIEMGQHALAIAREALSNVVRHAHATHVEVAVAVGDQRLVVRVVDNGVGLPTDARGQGGHGLSNMTIRADQMGGSVSLSANTPAGGTVVEWTIPLT